MKDNGMDMSILAIRKRVENLSIWNDEWQAREDMKALLAEIERIENILSQLEEEADRVARNGDYIFGVL